MACREGANALNSLLLLRHGGLLPDLLLARPGREWPIL